MDQEHDLDFHEFGGILKSVLGGASNLAFCRLPCAIWCVLLSSLTDKSLLARREYRNEVNLGACCFPAAPEGGLELLRRLGAPGHGHQVYQSMQLRGTVRNWKLRATGSSRPMSCMRQCHWRNRPSVCEWSSICGSCPAVGKHQCR
jgi:hypothetical protein